MAYQLEVGTFQKFSASCWQLILIFVEPVLRIVFDQPGVVLDTELVPHLLGGTNMESLTRFIADRVETETEFPL